MNILYICHRFPYPPKRGGKIRPFNMIKHLSQRHKVTVASLVRSEAEANEGKGIADHCEQYYMARINNNVANVRMVSKLATLTPSSMGYFYSADLKRFIDSELNQNQYDLIFVHCSSVAQYVENVAQIPKILDFGDMDSQKWLEYAHFKPFPLNMGYWLEGSKMFRAEKSLAKKFDYCSCTTRAEKETLDSYGVTNNTYWFPNGVDHRFFQPTDAPYEPETISFIGRMDYYPNQQCMIEFCRHVLPELQTKRPNAKLYIIGADPSEEIRALGKLPGVTVTGSVPDVRPYVTKTAVNVAPLNIARGTQNKILESMAMGVPVVCSTQAAGGIDAVAGEHFLVARNHTEYIEAILRLFEPNERNRFAQAARARMLSNHDWTLSMQKLDALIDATLNLRKVASK